MKPAAFGYHRAHDVTDAIGLLGELDAAGEEPKLLAGGQSLVPLMNFRLARPTALVDLARLRRLPGMTDLVHDDDGSLRVGALTTHRVVEVSPRELGPGFAVLSRAMRWVGHLPIRSRGTVGGSLVHGDATAEWCLLAVLLDGVVVAQGPGGTREIPAAEMFHGLFTTAVAPDEVVVAVRFTRAAPRAALREFARRHGDFAVVDAAVSLETDPARGSDPHVTGGRIVLGGVAPAPVRVRQAEEVLAGGVPGPALFADAAAVAAEVIDPPDDPAASARYRRRLTRTLGARALGEAWEHGEDR